MSASAIPSIAEARSDPALFGAQFRDGASWSAWTAFDKALFGLPMNDNELDLFRECTGRQKAPAKRASEAWLIVGRRGGKSRELALIAVYLATFIDWSSYLAPGERGTIVIVGADRRQCRVILNYVRAFLGVPLLQDQIEGDKAEEIVLANGITLEVVTASFRTIRGRTVIAALCDEAAFWSDEDGKNPASEVIAALRPAMATVTGAMLIVASSPYAKRGPFWGTYRRHYGRDGRILVWKAPTWVMNPTLSRDSDVIREAYELDEASARAEYGAEFRDDIASYVARETVEALIPAGIIERLPDPAISYAAFFDASGGSSDSATLAIAYRKEDVGVLALAREWKAPHSPEAVIAEACTLLKRYQLHSVTGDRYGAELLRDFFRANGITYEHSERVKSDIYRDFLPLLNSMRVELLDIPRLISQITSLERRTARGGRDSIDHPPGGQDDLANSVAGALVSVIGTTSKAEMWARFSRLSLDRRLA